MDEAWINSQLPVKNGYVTLETFPDGGMIRVSVTKLVDLFGAIAPQSYAELSVSPFAAQGWQKYFDDWKAQGIIS